MNLCARLAFEKPSANECEPEDERVSLFPPVASLALGATGLVVSSVVGL
jgi:hypothetical protein